jgi:hypothetical protein
MPHKFILQRIRFSISTLSKYVRVKKLKKNKKNTYLYLVVPPAGTNAPLPHWRGRGEETFVPGRDFTRYKCESFVLGISPGTNAPHRLYHMACTGSIPGTNESYKLVQMSIFSSSDYSNFVQPNTFCS